MTEEPAAGERSERRYTVLLSAFACEPLRGSEKGVGWNWALALSDAGHEIWVLTRVRNRDPVLAALSGMATRNNLRFEFYELPRWMRWIERKGRGVRFYHLLWQFGVFRYARRLAKRVRFDAVHHLTFGVVRTPSLLAFLGPPFVMGPLGGGETAPIGLRWGYSVRGWLADGMRDVINALTPLNPLMRSVYRNSSVILCKTYETQSRIPARYRGKCRLFSELGMDELELPDRRPAAGSEDGFRVLFVGRILYWKGVHLCLRGFEVLSRTVPHARLTIIGMGADEARNRHLAARLGIAGKVSWVPWIERSQVMKNYRRHDVLLFPSLHDSSGNVVLEAFACALPVICLNIGGPATLVDKSRGIRVSARTTSEAVSGIAKALGELARNPQRAEAMGRAGYAYAHENFLWPAKAEKMGEIYAKAIAAGTDTGTMAGAGSIPT